MSEIPYPGSELEVFAHARNWRQYVRSQIREYLTGDVLEIGAGIGSNTLVYVDGVHRRWVCLEPDPQLASHISNNKALGRCQLIVGCIGDLPAAERFDAIVYMEVLEHIADDGAELRRSARHLKPGGRIVVVGPAHQWLFTPFDRAIGHHRRYNAAMLRQISPPGLTLERLRYLDTAGIIASLGNRLILISASPTVQQIKLWDRALVPVSRKVDRLLGYRVGKTIYAVWKAV
jgi:SAM-dependent methyltransferase